MNEIKVLRKTEVLDKDFIVYGTIENPLFLAKDIASWIELTNVSDMVSRVDESELTKLNLGGQQGETWFLTEDGLYEVLMQSRKPIAKEFKKEVKRILKDIRKTGGYVNDSSVFVDSYFSDLDDSAKQFLIQTLDSKKKLLEDNKRKQAKIEEMKPKEEFYDTVVGSTDTIDMRQVATTLNIKGVGRNKMFEILRNNGILDRRNIPYQNYIERGYFITVESSYTKGDIVCINIKTVVFQKGLDFIKKVVINHLNQEL